MDTLGWPGSRGGADSVTEAKGIAAAEAARGYFALQLRYADALSARAGLPAAEVIGWHTNLHRLFGYGNLSKQPADPAFVALIAEVAALPAIDRLDCLVEAYAARPYDPWPSDRLRFGPHFACEAPTAEGDVRIHFVNRAPLPEIGPLAPSQQAERRRELSSMVDHIARTWPHARTVIGGSWLYNTEAYRRLFPAAYVASRQIMTGPRSTSGLSHWGQFIDFRGAVKPLVAEALYRNLETLDPQQPWLSFPFQVMTVKAPFAAFREEYGV